MARSSVAPTGRSLLVGTGAPLGNMYASRTLEADRGGQGRGGGWGVRAIRTLLGLADSLDVVVAASGLLVALGNMTGRCWRLPPARSTLSVANGRECTQSTGLESGKRGFAM